MTPARSLYEDTPVLAVSDPDGRGGDGVAPHGPAFGGPGAVREHPAGATPPHDAPADNAAERAADEEDFNGDVGVGPSQCLGRAEAQLRKSVPLPLVWKLRMHMDSCPGTNKSQFFYGGLGLILASGPLDCVMVVYMVVGHTKSGPDLVARQIAGRYNTSDTFNDGQLVKHISSYATCGAYDDSLL